MKFICIGIGILFFLPVHNYAAEPSVSQPSALQTLVVRPADLVSFSVWVPAAKTPPEINRSCQIRRDCLYTCSLPPVVEHTRTDTCPPSLARLLAQLVWPRHRHSLPLTILDGWRWRCDLSLAEFYTTNYQIPGRGGFWEHCLQAIRASTHASIQAFWLPLEPDRFSRNIPQESFAQSGVNVITFSHLDARHGYPRQK